MRGPQAVHDEVEGARVVRLATRGVHGTVDAYSALAGGAKALDRLLRELAHGCRFDYLIDSM